MKRMLLVLAAVLALAVPAAAQYDGGYAVPPVYTVQASDPVGTCTGARIWINSTSGDSFACYNGVWNAFGSSGGGLAFPLQAATGCTNPPFSFLNDTGAGLCTAFPGQVVVQSGPFGNNTGAINILDGASATVYYIGASGGFNAVIVGDGQIQSNTPRYRVNRAVGPAVVTTTVDLDLNDVASNTFLSFTNLATPAKTITFTQDSAAPSLTTSVTDGTTTFNVALFPGVGAEAATFGGFNATNSVGIGLNTSNANLGISLNAFNAVGSSTISMSGVAGNENIVTTISDGTASVTQTVAAQSLEIQVTDGVSTSGLTQTQEGFEVELSNPTVTEAQLALNGAATANNFLRLTNVADSNKEITISQNTSVPSLTTTVTDGTLTSTVLVDASTPEITQTVTDGTISGSVTVNPIDDGNVRMVAEDGVGNSAIVQANIDGSIRLEVTGVNGQSMIDSNGFLPPEKLFANLGTPANGYTAYCSDCQALAVCASGGTGAIAKRLNGAWVCN